MNNYKTLDYPDIDGTILFEELKLGNVLQKKLQILFCGRAKIYLWTKAPEDNVRWLSRGKVLQRFIGCLDEVRRFYT